MMKKTYLFKISSQLTKHSASRILISCFSLFFLTTLSLNAQVDDLNAPIAYYHFNQSSGSTVTDSSSNNATGVILDSDSLESEGIWVEGYLGNALELDGSQYISLPYDELELYSDLGSISLWAKAYDGRIRTMFSGGDNTTGGGFGPENEMHLHLEGAAGGVWAGGETSFVMHAAETDSNYFFLYSDPEKYNAGGPAGSTPINPITQGDSTWHHVVATWGEESVKLYIDGELIVEDVYKPDIFAYKLSYIRLGSMLGGGRTFVGQLDDIRIYDGVLSDQDVTDIFNNEFPVTILDAGNSLSGEASIYPNPVQDGNLNLSLVANSSQKTQINLINLSGQKVLSKVFDAKPGRNKLSLNVSGIQNGVYFLRMEIDGSTSVQRVVIK